MSNENISEKDNVQCKKRTRTDEEDLEQDLITIESYRDTIKSHINTIRNIKRQNTQFKSNSHTSSLLSTIIPNEIFKVPEYSIPIQADVRTFEWHKLYERIQFDVIMMDPPWQLATSNPTRGVALGYGQLIQKDIKSLPINKLQENGLLFIWVINASFDFAVSLFSHWGYHIIDELTWIKLTVNGKLAKSNGYYLQHAKEICLVGLKGQGPEKLRAGTDVILAQRRGQSQKPEEIYHLIEDLVPNGNYLEIFARKNNLRNYWISIGNELNDIEI